MHVNQEMFTDLVSVLSMLPSLRDAINRALDSDALTQQLKSGAANKLEIWEELKIMGK